jgi:hypothetical protein
LDLVFYFTHNNIIIYFFSFSLDTLSKVSSNSV